MHPDKIADRIAGALVDCCYTAEKDPRCAFEVLIGHNSCFITGETSVSLNKKKVKEIAERICGEKIKDFKYVEVPQDYYLAKNQSGEFKCGDNGVFAGFPMPDVHKEAFEICEKLYEKYPTDGKIVLNGDTTVNINGEQIAFEYIVNHAREYIKKLGGFEKLAEWGLR